MTHITDMTCNPHLLMKGLSKGLRLLHPRVKPHQSWTPFTTATNLHKDEVPSLPSPPKLVPLPRYNRVLHVCRTDNLQCTDSLIRDTSPQDKATHMSEDILQYCSSSGMVLGVAMPYCVYVCDVINIHLCHQKPFGDTKHRDSVDCVRL